MCLATAIQSQTDPVLSEFETFIKRFSKRYSSTEEYQYRLDIFRQRFNAIQEFNKREESFTKGINFFSDLTPRERLNFLGTSDKDHEDVPQTDDTVVLAEEVRDLDLPQYFLNPDKFAIANELSFEFPFTDNLFINWDSIFWWLMTKNTCKTKDWHTAGLMTDVKNQANCGSCWAFATVGLTEAMFKIKNGTTLNLSEQELVDCDSTNSGCSGGNMYRALTYIKNKKVFTEAIYPYVAQNQVCSKKTGSKYTIQTLNRTSKRNAAAFLNQLCKSPETVAFYVADDFFDYAAGIYNGAGCAGQTGVNHGVIAVGHNINIATPFVKFKNSWGSWWGENGYFRMKIQKKIATHGTCNMFKYGSEYVTV